MIKVILVIFWDVVDFTLRKLDGFKFACYTSVSHKTKSVFFCEICVPLNLYGLNRINRIICSTQLKSVESDKSAEK